MLIVLFLRLFQILFCHLFNCHPFFCPGKCCEPRWWNTRRHFSAVDITGRWRDSVQTLLYLPTRAERCIGRNWKRMVSSTGAVASPARSRRTWTTYRTSGAAYDERWRYNAWNLRAHCRHREAGALQAERPATSGNRMLSDHIHIVSTKSQPVIEVVCNSSCFSSFADDDQLNSSVTLLCWYWPTLNDWLS